jgi:two-component system cell cycle sensor histidine kinase/response regulator CckA
MVQFSADAIIGWSSEGVIESWNESASRVYGYSAEEAVGRHISMLAPPDREDETCVLLERLARGERIENFETVRVTRDGRRLDIALTLSPIRTAEGAFAGASTVARDITELKRAEKALRDSEARNRAIVESSLDAIVMMDAGGRIVEFNPAAERTFGWTRDEVIGRDMAELLVPARLRDRHRRALARYRAGGESALVGRRLEMPALRRDGTEFPVELTVTQVELRDPRAPTLFSATLRDITERREIDLLNARLAAIVQSSGDAIIGKTLDGVIESWNDGAEGIYGYSAEEAVGRHISILAPAERKDEIPGLLERLARGERIVNFETVRAAKDGRLLDMALTLSPIRTADGTVVGASTVGRDITELKRAEREQRGFELKLLETQKLESLGVLAGGIAHDFNNLLVGILGNASLALTQVAADPSLRETLERIQQAAERSGELTRQMLAYSGRGAHLVQAVDLSSVVSGMLELTESTISKKAALRCFLAPDTPTIEADVTQLRQVILNLITNASEALGGEGGEITVATGSLKADRATVSQFALMDDLTEGTYVFLKIGDSGCGMDTDTKAKMFDPFFTTKAAGTGLGLAAVLGIVRSHGGGIRVDSEPGRGTTFTLLFPASVNARATVGHDPVEESDWRGCGTVLVADDNDAIRVVLSKMLAKIGFSVVLAENGAEALNVILERETELAFVVLDHSMPEMDGDEVLAELKRRQIAIPIILSSGNTPHDLRPRAAGRDVAGFLPKPYRLPELAAIARQILHTA